VKRIGNVFDTICTPDNIRLAWVKTRRGKSRSPAVQSFTRDLDRNLYELGEALRTGCWYPGEFRSFVITDPKTRTISAAPLPDRIVHHAIMNVLDPIFDARLIDTTYACRRGKGTHAAVLKAFSYCRRYSCYVKMDVRKYFDSIDHLILKRLLAHLFKDNRVLDVLFAIIDSYHTSPNCGIPIGNLTSQYFANLYLAGLDYHLKSHGRLPAYIRYMDDFVLWTDCVAELKENCAWCTAWLKNERSLEVKVPVFGRTSAGLPFLGFRITGDAIYLSRKSKERYRTKSRSLDHDLESGIISEAEASRRAESLAAMTLLARARRFRNTVHNGAFLGHEPRQTRG
jgi:RNA-directed DNA polymerase